MKLSDFDYYLPKELIAQYPLESRDLSRMLVLDRRAETISHKRFKDISSYLKEGDSIVLNDSKVVPARIYCKRETGGKAEIFLLKKVGANLYEALVRPAAKLTSGKRLFFADGTMLARIAEKGKVGRIVEVADGIDLESDLDAIGQVPLPPYIKRKPDPSDRERYQTVYARKEGSTASPTAGLHFTEDILAGLMDRKIKVLYVTLHVSYGTFAPVKADDIKDHRMHEEHFTLPDDTARALRRAKLGSGRVLAVGTTSTRVLEHNADIILNGPEERRDLSSSTDLFIYPPYKFRMVDMLLTNFHLPKSTLLMLVSAFAGRDFIMKAYEEAVKERYRFYSYGDCMLIL